MKKIEPEKLHRWRCVACGALVIATTSRIEESLGAHGRSCTGELVRERAANEPPASLGELIDLERFRRYARRR